MEYRGIEIVVDDDGLYSFFGCYHFCTSYDEVCEVIDICLSDSNWTDRYLSQRQKQDLLIQKLEQ